MTVYVDDLLRGRWSHLFTDQDDQTELHELAQRIGLKRAWFQKAEYQQRAPWLCYYDVTMLKRRAAIAAGAVPITWREESQMIHVRAMTRKTENKAHWTALQDEQ